MEKIEALRDLLNLPDRSKVSIVALRGIMEVTTDEMFKEYAPTGDAAYVFVGPDKKLGGNCVIDKDKRTATYTFVLDMDECR